MKLKINFQHHPVSIVLGQIDFCEQEVEKVISEVRQKLSFNDIRKFELSYSSLDDFFEFVNLHSMIFKIGICTIRKAEPNLITAILKKLEDLPDDVKLIIIANSLPKVLLSRGIVYRLNEGYKNFLDQSSFEDSIISAIRNMQNQDKSVIAFYYKTWHKLLEVRSWLESEQITQETAIEMMKSIIKVGNVRVGSS